MITKVYILTRSTGDYESCFTDNIAAFLDEKKAYEYKSLMENYQMRINKSWENMINECKPYLNQKNAGEIKMEEYMKITIPIVEKQRNESTAIIEEMNHVFGLNDYCPFKGDTYSVEEMDIK